MKYRLKKYNSRLRGNVTLESSKSESNRVIIINKLTGGKLSDIRNLSNARDTQTMLNLIDKKKNSIHDVKDAGTTLRFLMAYFAINGTNETIIGATRMNQRPISPLVNALREIGVDINYVENEGCLPLKISKMNTQRTDHISIPGNISSQYISALLMIAPCLPKGLKIKFSTEIYSRPYIQMTLQLMEVFGVHIKWSGAEISVEPQSYVPSKYCVEGDWSAASYWYSFMAITPEKGYLNLSNIKSYSSQGDKEITRIMYHFGVLTHFVAGKVKLLKQTNKTVSKLTLDFRNYPDLAQTVLVVASVTGTTLYMTGLESLRIKETDRIIAMQNELRKIGAELSQDNEKWKLTPTRKLPKSVEIDTYNDHRIAMAFAPLCQLMDITINDPFVVEKSYPQFWDEVERLGIQIEKL